MTDSAEVKTSEAPKKTSPEAREVAGKLRSVKEQVDKKFEKELQKLSLPRGYLKHPKIFEKALNIIFEKNPDLLPHFIHRSWKMLKNISPSLAIKYLSFYKDQPWAKGVIINAAEKDPEAALKYADRYKDQPYYEEILEKAAKNTAEKEPRAALKYADRYKDQTYYPEVLEKAARNAAEKDPWLALCYVSRYVDQPWAKEVIMKAAEKEPGVALGYADHYKDQPYYEEILEKAAKNAAEKEPITALHLADRYKDRPWAKEVIMKASEKEPGVAIGNVDIYKDQPYYEEVLEKAVRNALEKKPWIALECAGFYKDQSYYSEILEHAARATAEKYPRAALRYVEIYKNQLYAKEVMMTAIKNDPWAFRDSILWLSDILPEWRMLLKKHEARIKIAEKGYTIPQKMIEITDFPINRKEFELYLLGINHMSKKSTTRFLFERGYSLITIPMPEFKTIFFSQSFQQFLKTKAGNMTYMNAFSLTQAVCRKLNREEKTLSNKNIGTAVEVIFEQWERVSKRELFGSNTKLILFTHEEERFDNKEILEKIYYRSGGKKENILVNTKGVEMKEDKNVMKEKVLGAIRNAEGNVTILFSGHGSQENWAFSANRADDLDHSLKPHPTSINYQELGDALIESKNIKNFNLIGSTCFSYDYIHNLFAYLESKGIKEKPYVSISAANKEKVGWGGGEEIDSKLLEAFYNASKEGESIRVHHFFKAEAQIWQKEDPALFIGNPEQYKSEEPVELPPLRQKTIPKPAPRKGEPEPMEIKPSKIEPTKARPKEYLEIAEQEARYFEQLV